MFERYSPIKSNLGNLLSQHSDKRFVVVGTTYTGKSTLLSRFSSAVDMDDILFPMLSPAERDYVCQVPWNAEIGKTMIALARERVKVQKGQPVFGTVVLDCDLIILLTISDDLLRQRTESRGVSFEDAKNMQAQLCFEVQNSKLPYIEFKIA